jgi:hypothetical protein
MESLIEFSLEHIRTNRGDLLSEESDVEQRLLAASLLILSSFWMSLCRS